MDTTTLNTALIQLLGVITFVLVLLISQIEIENRRQQKVKEEFVQWMESMKAKHAFMNHEKIIVFNYEDAKVAVFSHDDKQLLGIDFASIKASKNIEQNLTLKIIQEYFNPPVKKPRKFTFKQPKQEDEVTEVKTQRKQRKDNE